MEFERLLLTALQTKFPGKGAKASGMLILVKEQLRKATMGEIYLDAYNLVKDKYGQEYAD